MARTSRKQPGTPYAPDTAYPPPVAKTIYRAAAYIRQSSDKKKKGKKGESAVRSDETIESQQAIICALLADNPDIELVKTYIDNNKSGQYFERPAFQRMIADMESGKINCCITKDLSRLGRNAIDIGYYIEKFFPLNNIRYIAITDDYDSIDDASGGIKISLKNLVNEYYALDVSRKVRATFQMNIHKGAFMGTTTPYGYLRSNTDSHKLVVDEYAAGIVKRIFDMALALLTDGQGLKPILHWLNSEEIIPPKRYLYSLGLVSENLPGAKTQHWNMSMLGTVLQNRLYCGDMVQGKSRFVDGVVKPLPESEWVIVEKTHEAIISHSLFARVQKLYSKSKRPRNRKVSKAGKAGVSHS